jgi:hypothetical protein
MYVDLSLLKYASKNPIKIVLKDASSIDPLDLSSTFLLLNAVSKINSRNIIIDTDSKVRKADSGSLKVE